MASSIRPANAGLTVFDVMPLVRFAGVAGSLAGFLAVACGAFAAHALRGALDAQALDWWRTATLYLGLHAPVLLAVALLARDAAVSQRSLRIAAIAFATGVALFCGSLYALALGAPRSVAMAAPLGGTALMLGWIALGIAFWRRAC